MASPADAKWIHPSDGADTELPPPFWLPPLALNRTNSVASITSVRPATGPYAGAGAGFDSKPASSNALLADLGSDSPDSVDSGTLTPHTKLVVTKYSEKLRIVGELRDSTVPADVFEKFASGKLQGGFVGRSEVFDSIRQFLSPNEGNGSASASERVLLVTGEPGIGKSTAVAQLITHRRDIAPSQYREVVIQFIPAADVAAVIEAYSTDITLQFLRDRMIGYHICMVSNAITQSAIQFVRSLAFQFCSTVHGFTDSLIQSGAAAGDEARESTFVTLSLLRGNDPTIALVSVLRLLAATLQRTVPHSTPAGSTVTSPVLKPNPQSAGGWVRTVLATPSSPAQSPPVRYILIDSLDESLCVCDSGQRLTIAALLCEPAVANALPSWLRIVATCRPQSDVMSRFTRPPLVRRMDASGQQNLSDVKSYIRARLTPERMLAGAPPPPLPPPQTVAGAGSIDRKSDTSISAVTSATTPLLSVLNSLSKGVEVAVLKAIDLAGGNFLVASELVRAVVVDETGLSAPPAAATGGAPVPEVWSLSKLQEIVNSKAPIPGNLCLRYAEFLTAKRLRPEQWRALRVVMEVLLARTHPIPLSTLLYVVRLSAPHIRSAADVDSVLQPVMAWIRRERMDAVADSFRRRKRRYAGAVAEEDCYSLYHKSFADWLRARSPSADAFAVDVAAGHRRCAAAGLLVNPKITRKFEVAIARQLLAADSVVSSVDAAAAGTAVAAVPPPRACSESKAVHAHDSHFDAVVYHLRNGNVRSTEWKAFGVDELSFWCTHHAWEAMDQLIEENDIPAIEALTKMWVEDDRALEHSVRHATPDMVRAIWKHCKSPLSRRSGVIAIAPTREMIKALIDLGADEKSVFTYSVETVAAAEYLFCDLKRNINDFDLIDKTVSVELLRWLCANGRKINFVHPRYGATPVMYHATVHVPVYEKVRILLEAAADEKDRADPNIRNRDQRSILMEVAPAQTDIIDLLLEHMDPARNTAQEVADAGKTSTAMRMLRHPRWCRDPAQSKCLALRS